MRLRKIAAVSTLAFAASGLVALGGTATAATGSLPYNCDVPVLGAQTFNTVANVTPLKGVPGSKQTMTATVTVPASLGDTAIDFLQAKSFGGSVEMKTSAGTFTLKIPSTTIVKGKDTKVKATGKIKLKTGKTTVKVGDYLAKMMIEKTDGTSSPFDIACTQPATGNKVAGVVVIAKTATKTAVKAVGGKGMITSNVTVTGAKTGKVKLTIAGPKKVTKTVALKAGKAKIVVKKLKKGAYKVTAAYLGTATAKASKSKTVAVKVK